MQEHPHVRNNCVGVPPKWQFDSAQLRTDNAKAKLLTVHPSVVLARSTKAHITVYLYLALEPLWISAFFSFLIIYTVGRTPWTGDEPVARLLPIHRITQTQKKRIQTSTPRVGFEPTTPVFEQAKAVHALVSTHTGMRQDM
jgi:hypothetical protein